MLPHAISPTPGAPDSLACFSGCAFVTPHDGGVTALYTGVRPRRKTTASGLACGLLPPRELPCECFQLPPSAPPSPRGGGSYINLASALSSGPPSPGADGGGGEDSGGRLIGCAAELYAATLAADAEEALTQVAAERTAAANEKSVSEDAEEVAVRLAALSELDTWEGDDEGYGAGYFKSGEDSSGGPPSPTSPSAAAAAFGASAPLPLGVGGAHSGGLLAADVAAAMLASSPRPSADGPLPTAAAISRRNSLTALGSRSVASARPSAAGTAGSAGAAARADAVAALSQAIEHAHSEWLDGLAKQPFVETVCSARCAVGGAAYGAIGASESPLVKESVPVLAAPPAHLTSQLIGWRDPFVFADVDAESGRPVWRLLLGAGLKKRGGACLLYRSFSPDGLSGWDYQGVLCCADQSLGAARVGAMWECPFMVKLSSSSGGASGEQQPRRYMFCVSPDRPTNRVMYWTGDFDGQTFNLPSAAGPFSVDCGDVLYAPSVLGPDAGAPGRSLMFAWLQERDAARVAAFAPPPGAGGHRPGGPSNSSQEGRTEFGGIAYASVAEAAAALEVAQAAGYAGCLSLPRVLSLAPDGVRVAQSPAPELALLRQKLLLRLPSPQPLATPLRLRPPSSPASAPSDDLERGGSIALDPRLPPAMDVCLTFTRGDSCAVGLWRPPSGSDAGGATQGLLLLWLWDTLELACLHERSLQDGIASLQSRLAASSAADCGGEPSALSLSALSLSSPDPFPVSETEKKMSLRVFFDGSAVEAFSDCGSALATRMYRAGCGGGGGGGAKDCGGIQLVSIGSGQPAVAVEAVAWGMKSVWAAEG